MALKMRYQVWMILNMDDIDSGDTAAEISYKVITVEMIKMIHFQTFSFVIYDPGSVGLIDTNFSQQHHLRIPVQISKLKPETTELFIKNFFYNLYYSCS